MIDTSFDFYSDTPLGKDPDAYSPTLRNYHKILWSKPLPNGNNFELVDDPENHCLRHNSELGDFALSSDSIGHTYRNWKRLKPIISALSQQEIEEFFSTCSTIGAYIVFPANKIDSKMTINGARGFQRNISDRFDLTLECIRRYYADEPSPLSETLGRYSNFFNLFSDFRGYTYFFLLQDLVSETDFSVDFFLPFSTFTDLPVPKNVEEYLLYKQNVSKFIVNRNIRISSLTK